MRLFLSRSVLLKAFLLSFSLSGCASLPFFPVKEIQRTPSLVNLPYETVSIPASDGVKLSGWYLPAQGDAASPGHGKTLLFFHGSGGNISHRLDSLVIFHRLGLATLIIDYHGFGESGGKPSVSNTLLDAEAAWKWLTETRQVKPSDIILFGRSIGGAPAAALAAELAAKNAAHQAGAEHSGASENMPCALILESTFTTLYDVGKKMHPWAPVSWFLPQDYDTQAALASIRIPLLVVHSPADEIVPFDLGRKLYEGYGGPKRLLLIQGSHNDGFLESLPMYQTGLEAFLREMVR